MKIKGYILEACQCEEGNYPCSYCQKLAKKEIEEIDRFHKAINPQKEEVEEG